jgi:hypothetical protein
MALINKPNYSLLQSSLKIDDIIDPRMNTVSSILKHIHKGTIENAYTISNGEYEVIEAEIIETSELINKEIKNSNLPDDIRIGAVLRDKKVIIPKSDFVFQKNDSVVFIAKNDSIPIVENIFRLSSIILMSGIRIRYLSFFFGLIAILSLLNVIYSYYLNLYLNLNTYYLSFISSSIIGLIFYRFEKIKLKVTIFDKILTVFFGYLLLPIILSLPFYFSIYNLTFLNAFFEAISGFTSTGFTIFDNIKHIDQSLILWRSSIQWIGGLYFLFSIIYLIDIYDENFKKTLTNYLSFNSSEIFKQSFKIFLIYFGLTLLIFVVLNFLSIRSFNSFNLALTIISSGGFLPTNNLSDILKTDAQIIIFSLLLLFSFFSIFFFYNLIFIKKKI